MHFGAFCKCLMGLFFCRAYKHLQLCGPLLAGLRELSVHFHCFLLLFSVLTLSFVVIFCLYSCIFVAHSLQGFMNFLYIFTVYSIIFCFDIIICCDYLGFHKSTYSIFLPREKDVLLIVQLTMYLLTYLSSQA